MKNSTTWLLTAGMMSSFLETFPDATCSRRNGAVYVYSNKKCKSCRHLHYNEKEGKYSCQYGGYVKPMDSACSHYGKRKSKNR